MWQSILNFFSTNKSRLGWLGVAILICAAFWVASIIIKRKLIPWLLKKIDVERHPIVVRLIEGFTRPFAFYMKVLGIGVGILFFYSTIPQYSLFGMDRTVNSLPDFVYKCLRIAGVISTAWGLVSSSGIVTHLMHDAKHRLNVRMSRTLGRFLSAIINVLVVSFAAIMILTELGFNVSALVTGLGLGGLTVALAAKDSAANFFGGLVLIIEKPFDIGDWISTPDVEGTVEDISLRSTKVRTGAGSLTIVPNAKLSDSNITNWSGVMEKRQTRFTIGLEYGTPQKKIAQYVDAVREILKADPDILPESVVVQFTELGDSSLNIQVIYYNSKPGFNDSLVIRQRVNFHLMAKAKELGVEFAFPSQTLYVVDQTAQADGQGPAAKPKEKM